MLSQVLRSSFLSASLVASSLILASAGPMSAQTPAVAGAVAVPDRLVHPVDEHVRLALGGTVHPLANKANDRGVVPDSMKLERLQILLKRSDSQESELKRLIGDMHTPGTASYHKWMTPGDFGKKFGPSDADVAKLSAWLQAHGFSVTKLNPGRQTLEITGSAGQFRDTFHSAIHTYQVKGETHYANSAAPEIPAALAPVLGGFASLNNFHLRSHSKMLGKASYDPVTHRNQPDWTKGTSGSVNYVLAPADFAVQYDLNPLYTAGTNGTGQSIAVVNESNINIAQVNRYRTLFGLPSNPPQIIIDGNDPGVDGTNSPYGPNGASIEAYLDVEEAGAVAPNATINLVIAASTALQDGLSLAAERAVYSNISPVLSLSFGNCEASLGSSNSFFSDLWEQAAAQGITVLVSTGDSGSAGCDNPNTQEYAVGGQAVSGLASTPYNVAVGGTDFYYSNYNNGATAVNAQIATYWNATPTNSTPTVSLMQKVPEQPWNGSQFGLNASGYDPASSTISGGSGGASNCALGTADSNGNYTACTGGYPKPSWQTGAGVPEDGVRDLPDLSLYASYDANFSYYPICAEDGDCIAGSNVQITGVGGTSASTPAFAGIMALVNQKYGRQGQANYVLYPLAAQFPSAFNDVTVGSNSVPCNTTTVTDGTNAYAPVDCIAANPALTVTDQTYGQTIEGQIGVSGTTAYNAGVGYDLATGLGTVDATSLVTNWGNVTFGATTLILDALPATIVHGTAVTLSGSVTPPIGGPIPTGAVAVQTDSLGTGQQDLGSFGLAAGAFTGNLNTLPGGTYNVYAYYAGDTSNASSTSAKRAVTVTPENSATSLLLYEVSRTAAKSSLPSGTTLTYGEPILLSGQTGPSSKAAGGSATGTIAFSDSGALLNTAVINSEGDAEFKYPFGVGSHSITATYLGDSSYNASASSAVSFTVGQDTPVIYYSIPNSTSTAVIANQATILTILVENSTATSGGAAAPSGTVTLTGAPSGSTASATLVPAVDAQSGSPDGVATFTIPAGASGSPTLTFSYAGDTNYKATSAQAKVPFSSFAGSPTTTTATATATQTSPTSKVLLTTTITGTSAGSAPTGSFFIIDSGTYLGSFSLPSSSTNSVTVTLHLDSQNLFQGANQLTVQYSGDDTYLPSSATVTVTNPLSDFQMVPTATALSVGSSGTATDTINLTSTNSFAGSVSLTCVGSGGLMCSANPASASLAAGSLTAVTLSLNTNGVSTPGTYNAVVTGTDASGNFIHTIGLQIAVPSVSLVPGIGVTNASPITIASQGGSGTSTITVTPFHGFTGNVALTCAITSSPSGATLPPTCSLSPASVSLTSTAAMTSILTVNTTAQTTSRLSWPLKPIFTWSGGAALAAFLFFGLPFGRRSRKASRSVQAIRLFSLALLFALLAGAATGCGGGSKPTPTPPPPTPTPTGGTTTGAYTVTVTATPASGTAQTTTVALTVN